MRNPDEIRTFYGINMDPFHPEENQIDIRDIAHSLSLLCRANGHISHFYSVGQHCLNCEIEAAARGYDARTRLFCLLHDATECYMSDVTRPVKRRFPLYYQAETKLAATIYDALVGYIPTEEQVDRVSEVDDCLLYHEFLELCGVKMFDIAPERKGSLVFNDEPPLKIKERFIKTFEALKAEIAALED